MEMKSEEIIKLSVHTCGIRVKKKVSSEFLNSACLSTKTVEQGKNNY